MAYTDPMADEPDGDEAAPAEPPPSGPFEDAISEAFPEVEWTPAKIDALKEAIRVCYREDEAAESGPPSKGPVGGSGKGLALIFGAGPKKK